jgi:DNA-directed RNA polymerase specialized sigma24 family protein
MVHVRANGAAFAPETLVYVMREAITFGDTSLVEVCGRLLIGKEDDAGRWQGGHCEGTIVTLATKYRLSSHPDLMRAFRLRCFEGLWKAIFAGRAKKPFYEENFLHAFWQHCIDAKRSIVRRGGRDMEAGVTSDADDAVDVDQVVVEDVELLDEKTINRLVSPLHEAELLDAIRALPKRQAHAALLNWVEELPVEGAEGSVSAVMGVSPRAVYALLAKARAALQSDPVIRAIWFGEA